MNRHPKVRGPAQRPCTECGAPCAWSKHGLRVCGDKCARARKNRWERDRKARRRAGAVRVGAHVGGVAGLHPTQRAEHDDFPSVRAYADVHRGMSNAVDFANNPTLTVYPSAQSECAQILVTGQRYRVTVATRDYADGVWRRYTGTRDAGAPLTEGELASLRAAPRGYVCG